MMFPQVPFHLQVLDEVVSTNAYLFAQCDREEFHGLAVMAKKQSGGYGRRGRAWVFEPGNLALSLGMVLPQPSPVALLTFLLGLALHRLCAETLPERELQLKWPNDLYFQGKKLAGMLTQVRQSADKISVVMGVGCNLVSSPFPESSIAWKDYAPPPDSEDFARRLLEKFSQELVRHQRVKTILSDWEKRARLSHTLLKLENGDEIRPLRLLPSGELLVTGESGEQVLASEDVSVRLILPSL